MSANCKLCRKKQNIAYTFVLYFFLSIYSDQFHFQRSDQVHFSKFRPVPSRKFRPSETSATSQANGSEKANAPSVIPNRIVCKAVLSDITRTFVRYMTIHKKHTNIKQFLRNRKKDLPKSLLPVLVFRIAPLWGNTVA